MLQPTKDTRDPIDSAFSTAAAAAAEESNQKWQIKTRSEQQALTTENGAHMLPHVPAEEPAPTDEVSTSISFTSYNADSHTVMSNNVSTAKTVRSTKTYNISSRMTSTRQTSRQLVLNTTKDIEEMDLEDLAQQLENEDSKQAASVEPNAPNVEERFFEQLLNLEKERFSDLFPQLRCVRVKAAPVETSVRIMRNADGTITRIQTTQSRSVIRCSRTTKQDGSRTNKVTTAFVEYHGPEGKLRLKLDDGGANAVDSESDEEEEPVDSSFLARLFGKAYRKKSSISSATQVVLPEPTPSTDDDDAVARAKRRNRAYYAAEELVQTERRYVEKLDLLNEVFRKRVEEANASGRLMTAPMFATLFSNFDSIHAFHKQHFLPELENRLRHWQDKAKISDVVCQQAPFLKLYSDYINNYKCAVRVFEEMYRKSGRFAAIVNEIEQLPECDNLPLTSHIIAPVQRVMRYHLLMQEYLKSLEEDHPDREDTEKALELVRSAASHANEVMRRIDQYRDLVELQERLGGQVPDLVSPNREIIKQGHLNKLSSKSDESQTRHLFLLNDMLLVCSERVMALTKYKVKASLKLAEMRVLEGDRLDVENAFYVRTGNRAIEFCAKTLKEKADWMESLWRTIAQCTEPDSNDQKAVTAHGPKEATRNCSSCLGVFGVFRRAYVCQGCRQMVCKKCCRRKVPSGEPGAKAKRLCPACFTKARKYSSSSQSPTKPENNMQVIPASTVMLEGYMQFRTHKKPWAKAYFRMNKDFVLCRYENNKEKLARACMPLPGVKISLTESDKACKEFLVEHKNRTYLFRCSNQEETAKWMALLDLASRAEIPEAESSTKDG